MSDREAEVLDALGAHLSNAQIAGRLHISVRTVESHVASLLRKFGVADRRELAKLAPAARSTAALVGLPFSWTTFVGRAQERDRVLAALAESRLVSLVGPGGVGKTRLAAEVARDAGGGFRRSCAFVDLVPVGPGFIAQAVASLLGIDEEPGQALEESVLAYLARGRWLLVLDNCEHLLAVAAAFTERLLTACPAVAVLATSRERLGVAGERAMAVPPLSLAGAAGDAGHSEAAALFLDRARAVAPDFTADPLAVRELCGRLDGMPLAIELAAARSASLGMPGLLAALDDHLRLLAGGRGTDARHHSLRAVIAWSHDLLDDEERAAFRGLSVFSGGFDLDAAHAVAGGGPAAVADLVGRLADKNLLTGPYGQGNRWRLLETVRGYALERLAASGEEAAIRERHLRWADAAAADLERRVEENLTWRPEFDQIADDLRAAVGAVARPRPDGLGHRLARTLGHLAYARRFLVEAREHYENAARLAVDPHGATDLRSAAHVALAAGQGDAAFSLLLTAARRARAAGDDGQQAALLAAAVVIADRFADSFSDEVPHRRLCDLADEAARVAPPGDSQAEALVAAARAWNASGEKRSADPRLSAAALAAARRCGDPVLISGALDAAVSAARAAGRLRDSYRLIRERTTLLDRMPRHDPRTGAEIIDTIHMTADAAVFSGELRAALDAARLSQSDTIAAGQAHIMISKLVVPLALQGRFDEALSYASAMWESWQGAGRPASRWIAPAAYAAVLVHGLRGDDAGCREWRARAIALIDSRDPAASRGLAAFAAFADARVALHHGLSDEACAALADLGVAAHSWYERQHHDFDSFAWAVAAEAAVLAGLADAGRRLGHAAPAGEENRWAAACLARAGGILHGQRVLLEKSVAGWERIGARFERAITLLLLPDRAGEGRAELSVLGCTSPAVRE
jgi:predicted ATPase/DNA-binding CsgD family transcriptional regulator